MLDVRKLDVRDGAVEGGMARSRANMRPAGCLGLCVSAKSKSSWRLGGRGGLRGESGIFEEVGEGVCREVKDSDNGLDGDPMRLVRERASRSATARGLKSGERDEVSFSFFHQPLRKKGFMVVGSEGTGDDDGGR